MVDGFIPLAAGHIYPLKDPGRYDDELGSGYDHVAVPHDAGSIESCRILDVWVVNAAGEVHPGYGAVPIPMHVDDIEVALGRPLDAALPEPRSIFDSPWMRRAQ